MQNASWILDGTDPALHIPDSYAYTTRPSQHLNGDLLPAITLFLCFIFMFLDFYSFFELQNPFESRSLQIDGIDQNYFRIGKVGYGFWKEYYPVYNLWVPISFRSVQILPTRIPKGRWEKSQEANVSAHWSTEAKPRLSMCIATYHWLGRLRIVLRIAETPTQTCSVPQP
uniref:Uncharacterized protein n=1 Tax=Heterorhabditis bacteriophora TaxID=37862 RepID=A0A1I7WTF9_HETBA